MAKYQVGLAAVDDGLSIVQVWNVEADAIITDGNCLYLRVNDERKGWRDKAVFFIPSLLYVVDVSDA